MGCEVWCQQIHVKPHYGRKSLHNAPVGKDVICELMDHSLGSGKELNLRYHYRDLLTVYKIQKSFASMVTETESRNPYNPKKPKSLISEQEPGSSSHLTSDRSLKVLDRPEPSFNAANDHNPVTNHLHAILDRGVSETRGP